MPGCLSSGRNPATGKKQPGRDFRQVLRSFLQIEEPHLDVIRPERGRWEYAGAVLGVRSSLAWVTWDSQFLGVPQRRRRVFLVADFAGYSPIEILFIEEGMQGNSAQIERAKETPAPTVGSGIAAAGGAGRACEYSAG